MIKKRIELARELILENELDAMLITHPASRRYFSGYSPDDGQWGESSGALYLSHTESFLLTDFRYQQTAERECEYVATRIYKRGLAAELADITAMSRVKRMGFEPGGMLWSWYQAIKDALEGVELVPVKSLADSLRVFKDAAEIKAIEQSLYLMEGVLDKVFAEGITGKTERELALKIARRTEDAGAEGVGFAPIVASGPNGAEPHAEPGPRVIERGDVVIFDVGAKLHGYISDISRTMVAGGLEAADGKFAEVYGTVQRAQNKAIAEIMPGMTGQEADDIARQVITDAGFGENFGHSLGHGVGLMTHEAPSVSPRSDDPLLPGMVFTVEPGIYLPGWGGVRLEQMVELTPAGCRLLNKLDRFYDLSG